MRQLKTLQCHNVDANGVQCNFVRFAPGSRSSTQSPTLSPPLLQEQAHATVSVAIPSDSSIPVLPAARKCPIDGCGQNRIAPDCASQWCRKHCVALYEGICPSKKHKRANADGVATGIATASPSLPPPPPPALLLPSLPTAPALSAKPTVPPTNAVDSQINPRFSSQLQPVFADTLARDFQLREEKRREDIRRLDSERRAKQTVKVFAWTANNRDPCVCSFQSGFVWPFFNLSYYVLETIGLLAAGDKHALEVYDGGECGYWTHVDVGHIIEVREGHSIFLRSKDVDICPGFKEHLAAFRRSAPHFYGQLARERQYVHDYIKTYDTDWDLSTPRKRKASASPSGSAVSSRSTPSPPLPPSPPDIIEKRPPSSLRPSASTLSNHQTPSDTTIAGSDIGNTKEWPHDFHVCDIVKCFTDCKTSVKQGGKTTRPLKVVFADHFPGVTFKSSTYHDQHTIWHNAPEHLKKQFCEAGHTRRGRWIGFTAAIRQYNVEKAQANNDIIELSE